VHRYVNLAHRRGNSNSGGAGSSADDTEEPVDLAAQAFGHARELVGGTQQWSPFATRHVRMPNHAVRCAQPQLLGVARQRLRAPHARATFATSSPTALPFLFPTAMRPPRKIAFLFLLAAVAMTACDSPEPVDIVLRGGTIYDGSGNAPVVGDVALVGDSIVAVGDVGNRKGSTEIDVTGMAVAPGFVNMLSWATESLLHDGRGLSDVKQGVTLEVFGEGMSMGPINDSMRTLMVSDQGDIKFDVPWTTLGEYLEHMTTKGVSVNVASFVGATTVRVHELGFDNRPPTADELARMQELVRAAMREGALGVGSSLIYAPAFYAQTDELIALMQAAAEYKGMYISHMRSEANQLLEAIDELIRIARESGAPAEIYHLKEAGAPNWGKLDSVIARIERARADGVRITTDMYTYTAGATGLDAAMPPWVQEGGYEAWAQRMKDPAVRRKVIDEMRTPTDAWENLMLLTGSPERVLLVGFKADSLKRHTGRTLAAVATEMGLSPEEAAIELVIRDGSRVGTVYFLMDEDNVKRQMQLPYMSFGSDAEAMAPEGAFLKSNPHPRAYGNFARVLGKYVRDEQVLTLQDAVRRLSALPAENLGLQRRGRLSPGYFADVVVFDPATIADKATFEEPHQLAVGMQHVFVNGVAVLRDGEHTGATPGRVVRGPGWTGYAATATTAGAPR
jgi:N-acyl-D-amino-acid deacylase